MKKYLVAFAVVISCTCFCKAETLSVNFGPVDVLLPIASGITGSYAYDFRKHASHGLAETPFGDLRLNDTSKIVFKFGAMTTDENKGAPTLSADYELKSINNQVLGITSINPGIFYSHDFRLNQDYFGLKASIPVFNPI